MTYTIICRDAC